MVKPSRKLLNREPTIFARITKGDFSISHRMCASVCISIRDEKKTNADCAIIFVIHLAYRMTIAEYLTGRCWFFSMRFFPCVYWSSTKQNIGEAKPEPKWFLPFSIHILNSFGFMYVRERANLESQFPLFYMHKTISFQIVFLPFSIWQNFRATG